MYDRFLLRVRAACACSLGERERERRASCSAEERGGSCDGWLFVLRSNDGRLMGGSALWPGRRSREVLLKACANEGRDWDAAAAALECRTDMAASWGGRGRRRRWRGRGRRGGRALGSGREAGTWNWEGREGIKAGAGGYRVESVGGSSGCRHFI